MSESERRERRHRVSRGGARRAAVALLAGAACLPGLGQGEPRPASPPAAGTTPGGPPAHASFPPAAIARATPLPRIEVDVADVGDSPCCGSLDEAKVDDSGVFIYGFAYDPAIARPARAVVLVHNGQPVEPPIHVFRERPDVAQAMGSRALLSSGWALWIPRSRLTPGEHTFWACALLADGKCGRLAGARRVRWPPAGANGS
jgi:hypothetical protein